MANFYENLIPPVLSEDMDDVYQCICDSASAIELWIKSFIQINRVILPTNVCSNLNNASRIAGIQKLPNADDICVDCIISTGKDIHDHIRMASELMIKNIFQLTGFNPNNYISTYCQNNS